MENNSPPDKSPPPSLAQRIWSVLGSHQVVALGTIVLAIIAGRALFDTREVLESNQRAWVVPEAVRIEGDLISPLTLRISFTNTGRDVAVGISQNFGSYDHLLKIDSVGTPYTDADFEWRANRFCSIRQNQTGFEPTIYPNGKHSMLAYVFNHANDPKIDEIKAKKRTVVVMGCLTYKTFEKIRQSPFCFYLQPYRDRSIEDATFEACPISGAQAT